MARKGLSYLIIWRINYLVPCLQRFKESSRVEGTTVEDDWELTADVPHEEATTVVPENDKPADDSDSGESIDADDFDGSANVLEVDPVCFVLDFSKLILQGRGCRR